MAHQDLTPRLRTRLNRMERAVGAFLLAAVVLFLAGLGYYLFHQAVKKGWFLQRVPYYIYVADASGLNVGDPVRMMGFDIGRITAIIPMPPDPWFADNQYNVFIRFEVIEPNYGYIWTDSRVRLNPGDLLGNRQLEVMKGRTGSATTIERDGVVIEILSDKDPDASVRLTPDSKGIWLQTDETPVVSERINRLVAAVESALPVMTNQLGLLLSSSTQTLSNINLLTLDGRALASNLDHVAQNLAAATDRLREPGDSLGRWLFPADFGEQLESTLATAESTLTGVDTNLALLVEQVAISLENLALITSNLHAQVLANTNILSEISQAVVHTDELVQGLKRHWFLKSAFKPPKKRR
jgi:ABC-type transporter Mla subunit MlaD